MKLNRQLAKFPSPTGVLYISIFRILLDEQEVEVSVPYWGSLYFNIPNCFFDKLVTVSVPYWGSLYFNNQGL